MARPRFSRQLLIMRSLLGRIEKLTQMISHFRFCLGKLAVGNRITRPNFQKSEFTWRGKLSCNDITCWVLGRCNDLNTVSLNWRPGSYHGDIASFIVDGFVGPFEDIKNPISARMWQDPLGLPSHHIWAQCLQNTQLAEGSCQADPMKSLPILNAKFHLCRKLMSLICHECKWYPTLSCMCGSWVSKLQWLYVVSFSHIFSLLKWESEMRIQSQIKTYIWYLGGTWWHIPLL